MDKVVLALSEGIVVGGFVSLIAVGLVLCFRATHTFNFAHGQFMLITGFVVGKWQADSDARFLSIAALGVAGAAIVGAVFYLLVLRHMTGRPLFLQVVATLGLAAAVDGGVALIFGPSSQYSLQLDAVPEGVITVAGARIGVTGLVLGIGGLTLALGIAALLKFTRLGVRVRAAGQDPLLASFGAINVHRLYLLTWAAAGALGGLAGLVYGLINVVNLGLPALAFVAFPAILLGGVDSVSGAIVGAVAIGILQGFTSTYLGGEYTALATYTVLLLTLIILPSGLFGTRQITSV